MRHIELLFHGFGDAVVPDIRHDADNRHPWPVLVAADLEASADRIAACPVQARHFLVDERHELGIRRIARGDRHGHG